MAKEKVCSDEEFLVIIEKAGRQWFKEPPEIKQLWKSNEDYFNQAMEYYFANNRLPKPGFKPEDAVKQDSAVPKGTN